MRTPIITVGNFTFEKEPVNKGLIGGKVIATDTETGKTVSKTYKRFHTGKTNEFEVLAELMHEIIPPPPPSESEEEEVET